MKNLILFLLLTLSGCVSIIIPTYTETNRIREVGNLGKAKIIKMKQTGWFINENPEIEFLLEVIKNDNESYKTTTKEIMTILDLTQIRKGDIINIYIDPQNSNNVAIAKDEE